VFSLIECYDLYCILYDLISSAIIMHCTIGCLGSVVIANGFLNTHTCQLEEYNFHTRLFVSIGNIKYRDDQNRTLECLVII